jgi:hypothetical protein
VQRLTYAFRFIKACFTLAFKAPPLRRTWFYLWMGGASLLSFWLFPLGVVVVVIGLRPGGMILIGLFIILLLFGLLAWGEVTALETCRALDGLTKVEIHPDELSVQKREFSRWQDVFLWVLILPGLTVIHAFDRAFRPEHAEINSWLAASYLILPVISLEDLNLTEAQERIKQLVSDRLLRFHPDLVGVRQFVGVIQWLLILVGTILGFWVGLRIADPLTAGLLSRLMAMAAGLALAGLLTVLGIFLSSFNRACYYTALYQWALNVESARKFGDASQGGPPAIFRQVLRTGNPSEKES